MPEEEAGNNSNTTVVVVTEGQRRSKAIQELIQLFQQQETQGFYIHPALQYKETPYGGIAAFVAKDYAAKQQPIQNGDVLLVIPCHSRISYETMTSSQILEPKSLGPILLSIVEECERQLPDQWQTQNVCVALLIMYIWNKKKKKNIDNGISHNMNNNNNKKKNKKKGKKQNQNQTNDNKKSLSYWKLLESFIETWPSQESLDDEMSWTDDFRDNCQGTYAHFYKEMYEKAEGHIVDIVMEKLQGKQVLHHFCSCSKEFAKLFRPAWRIVNSRSHIGCLPGTQVSADIYPLVDLTNGMPENSKQVNVALVTNTWEGIQKSLLPNLTNNNNSNGNSNNNNNKNNSGNNNNQFFCAAMIATCPIAPNAELFLEYGDLPPSGFLVKYGCIPDAYVQEARIKIPPSPDNSNGNNNNKGGLKGYTKVGDALQGVSGSQYNNNNVGSHITAMAEMLFLQIPPTYLPKANDSRRIEALKRNDYPISRDDLVGDNAFKILLTPYDLRGMARHLPITGANGEFDFRQDEPEQLKLLRQYIILSVLANSQMIETFLECGQLRGAIYPQQIGKCLVSVVDYNFGLLLEKKKNNDTIILPNNLQELQQMLRTNSDKLSFQDSTCIKLRILHLDALAQWRHVFCRYYGIPSIVDGTTATGKIPRGLDEKGCHVCGFTLVWKACSNCKQVGYCCRDHQKMDWKFHKVKCKKVTKKK